MTHDLDPSNEPLLRSFIQKTLENQDPEGISKLHEMLKEDAFLLPAVQGFHPHGWQVGKLHPAMNEDNPILDPDFDVPDAFARHVHIAKAIASLTTYTRIDQPDDVIGEYGEIALASSTAQEPTRQFHRAYCQQLVDDAHEWLSLFPMDSPEHPVDEHPALKAGMKTLAMALASAAILNDVESVKTIAHALPWTITENLGLHVLDKPLNLDYEGSSPTVNPFCCALHMGAVESMQAMRDLGFPEHLPLGRLTDDNNLALLKKDDAFDVLSVATVFTPACPPSVIANLVRERMEASAQSSQADHDRGAHGVRALMVNDIMMGPKAGLSWVPAFLEAGLFDVDPSMSLRIGLGQARPDVVKRAVDLVDWDALKEDLEDVHNRMHACLTDEDLSDRIEDRDDACALFLQGAITAGREDIARSWHEGRDRDLGKSVQQPMTAMIDKKAFKSLGLVLLAGFDPAELPRGIQMSIDQVAAAKESSEGGALGMIRSMQARDAAIDLIQSLGNSPKP